MQGSTVTSLHKWHYAELSLSASCVVVVVFLLVQKALAMQRQREEMDRLAKIERESQPITVHGVREKLRPKLPYWKQKQLESSSSLEKGMCVYYTRDPRISKPYGIHPCYSRQY